MSNLLKAKQIAPGTNGYILTSTGTTVSWLPIPSSTDSYVTGSTLNGTTLELGRNNGLSALTTNLVDLGYTTGSGTTNYVPKWGSSTGLTDSQIYDDGTTVSINTTSPTGSFKLFVSGDTKVTGHFEADSKSFDISHPTKEGMRLKYGSLEGPEHGVYVRGKLNGESVIELPDYWLGLVDETTITAQLTAFGRKQDLFVGDIVDNKIEVLGDSSPQCFYFVQAERKDIDKITVEYEEK